MRSITITLRIDIKAVLSCGRLMQKQGVDPSTQPVSTVVRSTLEGLMRWLVAEGQIPEENVASDEALVELYREMFKPEHEIQTDGKPDFSSLSLQVEEEPSRAILTLEDITAEVERRANESYSEPSVARKTDPVETDDIPEDTIDLSGVNRMDIKTLAKISPKDVLIEKCIKGVVEQEYKWAVEIIYTKLSPDLWGTPTAEGAVDDLVKRHRKKDESSDISNSNG